MSGTGGEFIRHLAETGWARVSRKALDDVRLSIEARGVLAWLLTRPDTHRLYVHHAQVRMGLSQGRWQKIRRELEATGYLKSNKSRKGGGQWEWKFEVFDVPLTIGDIPTDGLTINGTSTDKRETGNNNGHEIKERLSNHEQLAQLGASESETRKYESQNQSAGESGLKIKEPLHSQAQAAQLIEGSKRPNQPNSFPPRFIEEMLASDFIDNVKKLPEYQAWASQQGKKGPTPFWERTQIMPALYLEYISLGYNMDEVANRLTIARERRWRSMVPSKYDV